MMEQRVAFFFHLGNEHLQALIIGFFVVPATPVLCTTVLCIFEQVCIFRQDGSLFLFSGGLWDGS